MFIKANIKTIVVFITYSERQKWNMCCAVQSFTTQFLYFNLIQELSNNDFSFEIIKTSVELQSNTLLIIDQKPGLVRTFNRI